MLCSISFAKGFFIVSPSYNPEIVIEYDDPEGCDAVLIYTPFAKRNNLVDHEKALLEEAYNIIVTADDITDICKEITERDLAVSDLFDISYDEDFETEQFHLDNQHREISITLSGDVLKNFAYLLYYDEDGFHVVQNVIRDGNKIRFLQSEVGPYALLVRTGGNPTGTGDASILWVAIIAGVCAVGIFVTVVISKKRENA